MSVMVQIIDEVLCEAANPNTHFISCVSYATPLRTKCMPSQVRLPETEHHVFAVAAGRLTNRVEPRAACLKGQTR